MVVCDGKFRLFFKHQCSRGFPLEHFSIEAIRANLAEAQRLSASSTTEAERAAAKVESEVFEKS